MIYNDRQRDRDKQIYRQTETESHIQRDNYIFLTVDSSIYFPKL